MKLTEKEEKLARLALDKGAKDGERQAAAAKLIESLYKRGVTVEDIEKDGETVTIQKTVYRDRPAATTPTPQPAPVNAKRETLGMIYTIFGAVLGLMALLGLADIISGRTRPAIPPVDPDSMISWDQVTSAPSFRNADVNDKLTMLDRYTAMARSAGHVLAARNKEDPALYDKHVDDFYAREKSTLEMSLAAEREVTGKLKTEGKARQHHKPDNNAP
jgi:hypothetical protein